MLHFGFIWCFFLLYYPFKLPFGGWFCLYFLKILRVSICYHLKGEGSLLRGRGGSGSPIPHPNPTPNPPSSSSFFQREEFSPELDRFVTSSATLREIFSFHRLYSPPILLFWWSWNLSRFCNSSISGRRGSMVITFNAMSSLHLNPSPPVVTSLVLINTRSSYINQTRSKSTRAWWQISWAC